MYFLCESLRFLGNRSKTSVRRDRDRDLNFKEITSLSSLLMAFLASVLVFPCR